MTSKDIDKYDNAHRKIRAALEAVEDE